MVPPASHRVSRVPWYSGYCSGLLVFVYWAFTIFSMLSQNISTNNLPSLYTVRNPEELGSSVWPVAISLAATLAIEFSFFSYCYLDVSVHSVPLHRLCIYLWIHEFSSCRFPHSDIPGSMAICASPRLFAAYHVLRRLSVPRHSPCALFRLT